MINRDLPTSNYPVGKRQIVRFGPVIFLNIVVVLFVIILKPFWFKSAQHDDLLTGSFLPKPRQVSEFDLVSEVGTPFTHADLRGHWTVLFAGYSYCLDICPATLAQLKVAKAQLGDDAERLMVLFLSLDPERDTPAHLADYIHSFGAGFHAVTGSDKQLKKLVVNLGLLAVKETGPENGGYQIDHSAQLILIDPEGNMAGHLSPPFDTAALLVDLKTALTTH